ncbi:MAG: LPS-assembly protein LptD [Synechococcus sp.]
MAPGPARTPTTGQVTIESDLQQADNRTGVITATGNVRIVYPDERVVATARQAQYFSQEGLVILSGDVDVIQDDGHSLRAEKVYYWVESERVKAEPVGGQQVFSKLRIDALQQQNAAQTGSAAAPPSSPAPAGPAVPRTRPAPAPQAGTSQPASQP